MVVGLGFLLYAIRSDLPTALTAVRTADATFLLGGLVVAVLGLLNLAGFHASAQRAAGGEVRVLDLVRPVAAGGLLNMIVKSGAMAGLAPMTRDARRKERPDTEWGAEAPRKKAARSAAR